MKWDEEEKPAGPAEPRGLWRAASGLIIPPEARLLLELQKPKWRDLRHIFWLLNHSCKNSFPGKASGKRGKRKTALPYHLLEDTPRFQKRSNVNQKQSRTKVPARRARLTCNTRPFDPYGAPGGRSVAPSGPFYSVRLREVE